MHWPRPLGRGRCRLGRRRRERGVAERTLGTVVSGQDLTRRFGQKVALDDVRFEVRAGELHALLGPNGAGKTTLIRILLGLVEPTEGSVELLGRDVRRLVSSCYRRAR